MHGAATLPTKGPERHQSADAPLQGGEQDDAISSLWKGLLTSLGHGGRSAQPGLQWPLMCSAPCGQSDSEAFELAEDLPSARWDLHSRSSVGPPVSPFVPFKVGDAVQVWSNSKNRWIEDGTVQEVTQQGETLTLAGAKLPVGSIMVAFNDGLGVKWVLPRHAQSVLRRVPRAARCTAPEDDFREKVEVELLVRPDLGEQGVAVPTEAKVFTPPALSLCAVPAFQSMCSVCSDPDDTLAELSDVEQDCRAKRCKYTDPDFALSFDDRVVMACRPQEIGRHDGAILTPWEPWKFWASPSSNTADWQLFRGQPRADDVQQGELGDCWFLSSLAALAEFQDGRWVRALLPGQESISPYGAYLVRLCIGGRWRNVLVDDRFPCIGGGSYYVQLAYCATNMLQLWASLIEKAFAKACGSYEAIVGGEAGEALTILTGWPCTLIRFYREDFDQDILWATLCSSRDTQFLMTCSTAEVKTEDVSSLVPFHVYSLITVFDVQDANNMPVRLLKIRNPHTKLKWQGAWSDASDEWTPTLREELGCPEGGSPAVFFMSLRDFLQRFAHCTICRIRSHEWHEARLEISLPNEDVPCDGVTLQASETTECVLSLAQPEERTRKGPLSGDLAEELSCIGFVLVDTEAEGGATAVATTNIRSRAIVDTDCWLQPGRSYVLVPLSIHEGRSPLITSFACASSRYVALRARRLKREAVRAAWVAWTRHNDASGGLGFHGGTLYMGKAEGGSIVALLENRAEGYFGVELTLTCATMRFSRGAATTLDWLPPGCGQILQVAVPDDTSGGSVSWQSSYTFYMRATPPEDADLHRPLLTGDELSLHAPFRLAPG